MGITFVGVNTFVSGSSSVTALLPEGVEEGDLLLLHRGSTASINVGVDGWTPISDSFNFYSNYYAQVLYKIAGASEGSVLVPDISGYNYALISAWRGVDPNDPINAYNTSTDSGTTYVAANPTSTKDNCMLVGATYFINSSIGDTTNYDSIANTSLESITEAYDISSSTLGAFWITYGIKATAGAINNTTATGDNSTGQQSGTTSILLNPIPALSPSNFFVFL